MRSELITDRHLARCAVIYVRQSSPHQVLSNRESLRLQYDLRQRALSLGWRDEDVAVIDADLGLSGAAATHREGFKELIARVTLGQVGAVLSSEVTRLTRNCSDWYPLLHQPSPARASRRAPRAGTRSRSTKRRASCGRRSRFWTGVSHFTAVGAPGQRRYRSTTTGVPTRT
jgi:hypothetical protein